MIVALTTLALSAPPLLELEAVVAVEVREGGRFVPHVPESCLTPPPSAGNRMWLDVTTSAPAQVYVVAVDSVGAVWRLLAHLAPTGTGALAVFPEGHVFTPADSRSETLLVVAATSPIPVLDALKETTCPPDGAAAVCADLQRLQRAAPRRVRGCVPHETAPLRAGNTPLVGIAKRHQGEALTAIEQLFRVRR